MLWSDFAKWFDGVDMCNPTLLSTFSEGDQCRCDVLASQWVAGRTAGGSPPCSTFKFNPAATMSVSADGQVSVTLFQPDTRFMYHPHRTEDIDSKMAFVYLTDMESASGYESCGDDSKTPQRLLQCHPWERQKSATITLSAGRQYHITAATFAPGAQGAFWIVVSGYGLTLEALPFGTPTADEATIMEVFPPLLISFSPSVIPSVVLPLLHPFLLCVFPIRSRFPGICAGVKVRYAV